MWFPILRALSIPNILTSGNLLLGLAAIHLAAQGDLLAGMVVAALAAPVDMLDGWAARRLNQQSPLGARLDSMADLVSFGVAPAVLAAQAGVPFAVAAIYALSAAWRLLWCEEVGLQKRGGRTCFHGMPSPLAAVFLLAVLLLGAPLLAAGAAVLLAVAMLLDVPVQKNGPLYIVAPVVFVGTLAVRLLLPLG